MGCCGEKRRAAAKPEYVRYVYTGSGQITVKGGMTGRDYVFNGPGSIQDIDRRDQSNIGHIPGLKIKQ